MSTIWYWSLWWVSALAAGRLFSIRFSSFLCQRSGRTVLLGWNEASFCLFWMVLQDFAMESGPWQNSDFQNLKFRISELEFQTVVKTIFVLSPLGWLFLAGCLMQPTELTYLHGLKRLFSLLASPSWMTHLRSSCWQRRCFWSCRWHCQHLNEVWCQGKHMKNVGNNTVNCMWILKNGDVSVDERCCAFFIMTRKSIFPSFPFPSVPALAIKISLWPTINWADESKG